MFEYYGWAVLRAATDDFNGDLERELLDLVRRRIESRVDRLEDVGRVGTEWLKGTAVVWFVGVRNHVRAGPLDFLRFIAGQAPGAYGLLYVRDSDDNPR